MNQNRRFGENQHANRGATMNWKWIAVVFGVAIGIGISVGYEQYALAQTKVDQGAPGNQGPWVFGGYDATTATTRRNSVYDLAGRIIQAPGSTDGTAISLATSTMTATATTVDAKVYRITNRGTGAECIWGGTATLTTGFWLPVDAMIDELSEGTSFSCITVAGTGVVQIVPRSWD